MPKSFLLLLVLLVPFGCLGQISISGRVLNQADKKPIANASVFLSNASVGGKTADDGSFTLNNAKPGKYELVVSVIGYETYRQSITINNTNINIPAIEIYPRITALNEVSIKAKKRDPYKARNYDWFKDEFLGTSLLARQCEILTPEVLDINYDEETNTLTVSSFDFLEIKNEPLGYKIKYLLSNFTMKNEDEHSEKNRNVQYEGEALFENLEGSPAQQKRWQKQRQEVYKGSLMHFLRAANNDKLAEEGFRVLQLPIYKKGTPKPMQAPLYKADIVRPTDQEGIYVLGCEGDAIHITYNENHHFPKRGKMKNLDNSSNTATTILRFNEPYTFFNSNGGVINPASLVFTGAMGNNRIGNLLPVDYEPEQGINMAPMSKNTDNIIARLKDFSEQHVTEKAYLHFDKPYYAAGDTIYFKAYVTLGEEHQPSDLSGVLHVDLVNTDNKVDQSIKLQLTEGVAWGDFALPDSLPKGSYRVRAYTNWMRNEGDGANFSQAIPVGSVRENKTPLKDKTRTAVKSKPDIQFFPEGGRMVNGTRGKIAFKAIGAGGLGINVKGVIIDNENHEVALFTPAHLGMGYFYLTPQEGKTYQAKLTYADGTQNTVPLPIADGKGIVLSVNNDPLPNAAVKIAASDVFYRENKNKQYTLLIYSGGVAVSVACRLDSQVVTLDILKRRLHTGIATVTLFSPDNEPVCERLLFIQNYDQLSLAVNSDKTNYTIREKVNIKLNVKNRAGESSTGHFSVAVVDESKVPVDENEEHTILNDLLLTSDLKGYIEQPNYYFLNTADTTRANLDLVMLTHGYRRFEWKTLLSNGYPAVTYSPEKALEINGIAESLSGKPLVKGKVSLISNRDGSFLSEETDDKGYFRFSNLVFADTTKFILQAINANGKNKTKLIYNGDRPLWVDTTIAATFKDTSRLMNAYLKNSQKQQEDVAKYGNLKGRVLKEVTIKDKKMNAPVMTQLVSPEFADQVITQKQMAKGGPFSGRIQGLLRGIIIKIGPIGGAVPYQSNDIKNPMKIIYDGLEIKNLDEVLADEVESVEVLRFANATIYGGPVLVITSKKEKGLQAKDISSTGILPIKPRGFYKARVFYMPKYDNTEPVSQRPDLRTTIYWNPEIVTDSDGNTSFSYYNADGHGTYKIVIEGIDDDGNLGRQVYRYAVN